MVLQLQPRVNLNNHDAHWEISLLSVLHEHADVTQKRICVELADLDRFWKIYEAEKTPISKVDNALLIALNR